MSKANLDGRQADVARPDEFNLGGFDEDGRSVVKKSFKSGKPADKPGFFLGGSDPTVPTGPKVKLRSNWMSSGNSSDDAPAARVEHVPKAHKKWTPAGSGTGKKGLPKRCKSHDGTMTAGTTVRKGKKKPAFATKKAENDDATKNDETTEEVGVEVPKTEEPKIEESQDDTVAETKPAWEPPKIVIRKSIVPTEADKKELEEMMKATDISAPVAPTSNTQGDCNACADKNALIAKQAAEIEALKAEKGELAAQVKKIKGSQKVNTELKEQVFELQQQLKTKDTQDANSKGFTKLENKLNTLKMVTDGSVNKDSLEELQEHVSMINMVLNQDLKKEGMKNVWT